MVRSRSQVFFPSLWSTEASESTTRPEKWGNVLFVVALANDQEYEQLFVAIFTLAREEILKHIQAGTLNKSALNAHDYVCDILPGFEEK